MFFYEPTHKYFKDTLEEENNFISASGIVEKYAIPYDMEYWTLYKAYEFLCWTELKGYSLDIDTFLEFKSDAISANFKVYRRGYRIGDYSLFDHLRMWMDENKAAKIRKYIHTTWRKENKISLVKGNNLHNYKERSALETGFVVNPFTGNKLKVIPCNKWISSTTKKRTVDLTNLEDGYYAELIVDFEWGLGQLDKLYVESRVIFVDDWKTNKKIETQNQFQRMRSPVQHLEDCNFNHYRIQLSFYIWILLQYDYTLGGCKLTHCILKPEYKSTLGEIDNDLDEEIMWEYKAYPFDYLETEIEDIITDIRMDKIENL